MNRENWRRRLAARRAVFVFVGVCEVRPKDDKPGFFLVGHVAAGNTSVDLGKIGPRSGCLAEAFDNLVAKLVVFELPRPIIR